MSISYSKLKSLRSKVKSMGGKYIYDNMSKRTAESIYSDAVRLSEAGYDLSKYRTVRDLDKASSKVYQEQKRAKELAEMQKRQDIEYVKKNLAQKDGYVYMEAKTRKNGVREVRKTLAEKYAKNINNYYNNYKVVDLNTYESTRDKNYRNIKKNIEQDNARKQAEQAEREASGMTKLQQMNAKSLAGRAVEAKTITPSSSSTAVKFTDLSAEKKAELRKNDNVNVTYTDIPKATTKSITEKISVASSAPITKIPETKVVATPIVKDPYSSFGSNVFGPQQQQSTMSSPGPVAKVITIKDKIYGPVQPKTVTTKTPVYGPVQQKTIYEPVQKTKLIKVDQPKTSIISKIYGTAKNVVTAKVDTVKNIAGTILKKADTTKDIATNIISSKVDTAKNVVSKIPVVNVVAPVVVGAATSTLSKGVDVVDSKVDVAKDILSSKIYGTKKIASTVVDTGKNIVTAKVDTGKNIAGKVLSKGIKSIPTIVDKGKSAAKTSTLATVSVISPIAGSMLDNKFTDYSSKKEIDKQKANELTGIGFASSKEGEKTQSTFSSPGLEAQVVKPKSTATYDSFTTPYKDALQMSLMPPKPLPEKDRLFNLYERTTDRDIDKIIALRKDVKDKPGLQLRSGEEEDVALKATSVVTKQLIKPKVEKIKKLSSELDEINNKIASRGTDINQENILLIKRSEDLFDKFNIKETKEIDPVTGEEKVVLTSETLQRELANYNKLKDAYEANPTQGGYEMLEIARLNQLDLANELDTKFSSLITDSQSLQKRADTVNAGTKSLEEQRANKEWEIKLLNDSITELADTANVQMQDIKESDTLYNIGNYFDNKASGKYATGTFSAGKDWLEGEIGGLLVGAAKGGRGIVRAFGTEAIESVGEDFDKKGYVNTFNPAKGGIVGSYGKGVLSSIYKKGEYEKIGEEIAPGVDLGYNLENKKLMGKVGGVWEQTDKEALSGVITVGALGVGSAVGGAATTTSATGAKLTVGKAIAGAKGSALASTLAKGYVAATAVPKVFTTTSMYSGEIGEVGGKVFDKITYIPNKVGVQVPFQEKIENQLSKTGLPQEARSLLLNDRETFVDAMRAGYANEDNYNKVNRGTIGNFLQEIPFVPVVTGGLNENQRNSFKSGVRSHYVQQGYSLKDANLAAEAAWKQRNSGLVGEGFGIIAANVASEFAGQKFLSNSMKSIAPTTGKIGTKTLAKIGGKGFWEVGQAGLLEGVAVAKTQQTARYEKLDPSKIFAYGAGGFVTAGALGGVLATSGATGKKGLQKTLMAGVYGTDPAEISGDLIESGVRKGAKRAAKKAIKRLPVGTMAFSPTSTMSADTATNIDIGSMNSNQFTFTGVKAPTATSSFSVGDSTLSLSSPVASDVTVNKPKAPNVATSSSAVDKILGGKIIGEIPSSSRSNSFSKSGRSAINIDIPSETATSGRATQTLVDVPSSPFVNINTEKSTSTGINTDVSVLPNVNIPTIVEVSSQIPSQVPTDISTSVPTAVTTSKIPPYLSGGFGGGSFLFGRQAGVGQWSLDNKLNDIAGNWLRGQKSTGTLSQLNTGTNFMKSFKVPTNLNSPKTTQQTVMRTTTTNNKLPANLIRASPKATTMLKATTTPKKTKTSKKKTTKETPVKAKKKKSFGRTVAGIFR